MLFCFCTESLVVTRCFLGASNFVICSAVVERSRWEASLGRQRERGPSFDEEGFVWVGVVWQVISHHFSPVSVSVLRCCHVLYSELVWCHVPPVSVSMFRCCHVLCSVLIWCPVSLVSVSVFECRHMLHSDYTYSYYSINYPVVSSCGKWFYSRK